jgi:Holliday junction resolvasome RuvABC endonuclease subunit
MLRLIGFDPSLRNWGMAEAFYSLESGKVTIQKVGIVCPVLTVNKQIRQNSLDLESAQQLYAGASAFAAGAHAVFVEVPVGSQSARAMASYGICVGVLGALRENGIPFFELTPNEIKLAGPGNKTATKEQMIAWATTRHPEANWPTYKQQGQLVISEAKAEHMADAVAAIHAGIACNPFRQLLRVLSPTLKANHANQAQAS